MPDSKRFITDQLIAKLIFAFLLAALLFNYPIIDLFRKDQFVLGLPALYLYFFSVWLALVIFIRWMVRRQKNEQQTNSE